MRYNFTNGDYIDLDMVGGANTFCGATAHLIWDRAKKLLRDFNLEDVEGGETATIYLILKECKKRGYINQLGE